MASKNELRKHYKLKRLQLSAQERSLLSHRITKNVLQYLVGKEQIQHIHVYLPIEKLNEVNTFPLIEILQQQGREVYTSISNHTQRKMQTVKLAADQWIEMDQYGIPVPSNPAEAGNDLLQMVLVPLLAYDLKGHRLGYGKGFYDRFLSDLLPGVLKVGLSFFPPEKHIPTEIHDVRMDLCIHPEGVNEF